VSGPLVLVVIDGLGLAPPGPGNAVTLARTPNLDALAREASATRLVASGLPVGLPEGQQGNSEVGHLNLGAGRRVPQMLVRIDEAIADGSFDRNPVLTGAMDAATASALHLIGLVGGGGVHASQRHLLAMLELAAKRGVERVRVHALTDGRDSRPDAGLGFVEALEAGGVDIRTLCGRYWAMDRDRRWDRTKRAYDALVHAEGLEAPSAQEAIRLAYARGETDEFVQPTVIGEPAPIRSGDSVLTFNFRPDRMRQLVRSLGEAEFDEFDRREVPRVQLTTMTRYQ